MVDQARGARARIVTTTVQPSQDGADGTDQRILDLRERNQRVLDLANRRLLRAGAALQRAEATQSTNRLYLT